MLLKLLERKFLYFTLKNGEAPSFCFARRHLSTSSKELLKSFSFQVHPDFFTAHPKEQMVNSENLKVLNQMLSSSNPSEWNRSSSNLTFYLKPTSYERGTSDSLQKVLIPVGPTLMEQLHQILTSRGAKIPGIQRAQTNPVQPKLNGELSQPWQNMSHFEDQRFGGYREPKMTKRTENLKHFLTKLDTPQGRQGIRRRKDAWAVVSQIQMDLCSKWGFRYIEDRSGWSSQNMMQLLTKLAAALNQHEASFQVSRFEGFSLLIVDDSQRSAVSALESQITLSPTDPPGVWMRIFGEVSSETVARAQLVTDQLVQLQRQASSLHGLEGVKFKIGRTCTRVEFLDFLKRLCSGHSTHFGNDRNEQNQNKSRAGIHVVVENSSRPKLKEDGNFQIGSQATFSQLIKLMERLGSSAFQKQAEEKEAKQQAQTVMRACIFQLKLKFVSKEPQISWMQMNSACSNFIDDASGHQDFLKDKAIRVGNIFSVTGKGELRIPWEWH
mmetsp:Transcript_9440/g.12361  ORF Transcript_9440/g.12361 Transcript_9440/m.12361 type:complete len:496 (+) Transcript_9440:34-1521(+)